LSPSPTSPTSPATRKRAARGPKPDPTTTPPGIRVAHSSGAGKGVFATRDFATGDVIEICPVLVIPFPDAEGVLASLLGDYAYGWDEDRAIAVALGCGSLYNHATPNNADYAAEDDDHLVIYAKAPIATGEEILIDYTGGGDKPLWFTPR
jgi:uncharacterized protein